MKRFGIFYLATLFTTAVAFAQSPSVAPSQAETKKTTKHAAPATAGANEAIGTIVEFVPGGDIVLNTGAGQPARFKLGKGVQYLNPKGKAINERKMKKDRRVRVHYAKEGNDMVVDKIQVVREGGKKKGKKQPQQ